MNRFLISMCTLLTFAQAKEINFNQDIRPILSDRCFHCHGPDKHDRKKDLRLDVAEGDDGAYRLRKKRYGIVPGDLEKSSVWQRIITDDEDDIMPPIDSHKKQLTKGEKALIKQWIEEGAKYEDFWAFVPPVKGEPKKTKTQWGNGGIDQYVLAILEKNSQGPSGEADKRTLIRRLSFDLTGLPPTAEEIKQFLNDSSENAYEELVDRLIAKPQYGEHMTKYWLDLVRFADTNGRHHDHYRDMTPYRDWVIKSFNQNLSYDDFVRYQVAGDLYNKPSEDQLVASGFNRLHLIIDRGTAPPEESLTRNVIDRVTSVGTAFMGLTVQCAVCHDHKYDPITQKDFFALYAFFNNFDGRPETGGRKGAEFKQGLQKPYIRIGEELARKEVNPTWIWKKGEITTEKANFKKSFTLEKKPSQALLQATCDNSFKIKINGKHVGASKEWNKPLKKDVAKFLKTGKNLIEVEASNIGDAGGFVAYLKAEDVDILSDASWQAQAPEQEWHAAVELNKHGAEPWKYVLDTKGEDNRRAAMVMKERKDIRPAYILLRGEYDQLGEVVERNTPEFLPALKKKGAVASRMDLANWLIESNPLTGRIAVNRFWQQLFGVGLVKTSEDFGAQGEVPSHPKLLDYLTVSFEESGWDVKALMKKMVMSKTYRQSSKARPQEFKADAENRLLARGSRFRMDSEMIRDQILAQSGLLSDQMYGPSVKPPQPDGLWKAVTMPYSYPKIYEADRGEAIYRRSMYTFWKRGMPPPQMSILNAPERESCVARRERTNTPLQALLMMNEPEFFKMQGILAQKLLANKNLSDVQRIQKLYEQLTSQLASKYQEKVLLELLENLKSKYRKAPEEAKETCVSLGINDALNEVDLASWAMLVNTLYSLDTMKTRE
jgi:hypothetical protein